MREEREGKKEKREQDFAGTKGRNYSVAGVLSLTPKKWHICPELIHMLTTRCLNNIIDTFMRGYSSLALTSPSPPLSRKRNETNKLQPFCRKVSSILRCFLDRSFATYIVCCWTKERNKGKKGEIWCWFISFAILDQKNDAVNVIELWSDCCYS